MYSLFYSVTSRTHLVLLLFVVVVVLFCLSLFPSGVHSCEVDLTRRPKRAQIGSDVGERERNVVMFKSRSSSLHLPWFEPGSICECGHRDARSPPGRVPRLAPLLQLDGGGVELHLTPGKKNLRRERWRWLRNGQSVFLIQQISRMLGVIQMKNRRSEYM